MKILLINAPIRLEAEPNCIPYGLATIASVLRNADHLVDIYDINALRHDKKEILQNIQAGDWDMIGLSGLITTYQFQKWLIREVKTLFPDVTVVSGGGLATSMKENLLYTTDVDLTVLGEGEKTMVQLCGALEEKRAWNRIPGIMFRRNGRVIETRPRTNIHHLDEIPFPAWDMLPMGIYLKNPIWGDTARNSSGFKEGVQIKRSMNIIASRGCPYACRYCYNLFGPSSYRIRSPENIMDEVEILVTQYGVDFIGFVDDNLMSSRKHILELCRRMTASPLTFKWGCHGRVNSAKPEVLWKMAEAGCVWIGYGIESGSQTILDAMNKKVKIKEAEAAIINTRKAGIYANTTFIFGYPNETHRTVQETIDFKKKLNIQCGSFFATPYPGTSLYDEVKPRIDDEIDYIKKLGDATRFSINLTRFDDHTLFKLKKAMDNNMDIT